MEQSGICQPSDSTVAASLADKAPAVLQRYFQHTPTFLTQHHVNTYEACIFREIPEIIYSDNPIVILKEPLDDEKGIYKYKTEIFVGNDVEDKADLALDVGPPILTLDGGKTVRRMFPNEARIRNLTYAAQFRADILVRLTFTNLVEGVYKETVKEIRRPGFPLFRIPILLRSKLCATHGADTAFLQEMGECPHDQGGYFIVDGAEKVIVSRQEQALNSVFVSRKPENDLQVDTYATVVCQHPQTKQTKRVAIYRLHETLKVEEGAIRASIPFVKGTIPLFVLFRALGVESDEDIVRMIVPVPNTNAENSLIASIHDAHPITTQFHAIEFIRTLTKGFITANVLSILHDHLFAHVPDRPMARAQYLADIVRKMIRVEMGQEPNTNRDDIRNQRLLPTGILLRGLFADCWKTWKKAVIHAVDIQYNYNRTTYQDDNFLDLFSLANMPKIMATNTLNDSIMRGFRGRWGTNQFNIKSGVVQPLARISYLDAVSHTRRVVSDFDTSLKLVGPRQLHTSQVGYFCTAETPTGAHIGATKNLSILTAVSVAIPAEPIVTWLLERGGVVEVAEAPLWMVQTATSVQVNGGTIGFTAQPGELTKILKLMKWTGCLSPMASISFNTSDNVLRVYLDDGRPLRPLWHLGAGGAWPAAATKTGSDLPTWRNLLLGTFPPTATFGLDSVAFVDPLANEANPTLEDYQAILATHVGAVEYVDPYEGNEAYVSWWGNTADLTADHTHAEIHPSTLMGVLASMIPFANHNQSPRNQLSCSQSKQAIGYYATNYENRFDTYGSMLCYGEAPLCRTIVYDAIAGGRMPYGTNLIFAFNSFNGYNQDDGILFNRSSIERGLFRSLAFRSYEGLEEEDTLAKAVYRMGNPAFVSAWTDLRAGYDYSQLDETGVIREGAIIHEKTVLVGRYMTLLEVGRVADASVVPTVFTKGRVDKVVVLHQANGMRLVKIRVLEERVPELGDKNSTRHGQKGTMGMLMDAQDMPRTVDGIVPDVMINPHCIPSRMTMAQMLEQLFGKLGAQVGAKINATSFMNDAQSLEAVGNALETLGLQRMGEDILYSGITGEMFSSSVFIGPLNFMRLKHLTQDKLNARGGGRREMRTHQPTGGRGNEGGMRIGEMERDVLMAHGITDFLQESMMKRSDGTTFWICNGCGTIPIVNEAEGLFVCPSCDGPLTYQGATAETISLIMPVRKSRCTFSRVEMPYAMKLLDQELTTFMNAGLRFVTAREARTFKDPASTADAVAEVESPTPLLDVLKAITAPAAAAAAATAAATATASATTPTPVAEPPPDMEMPEMPKKDATAVAVAAAEPAGEEPEDREDEGQPAKNESEVIVAPVEGQQVVDFDSTKLRKEFSTYSTAKFMLDGKEWPTVEHYFQAAKFPMNPPYQEQIRLAKTPAQAKRMGKTDEVAIHPDWTRLREEVMLRANRAKFQIPALRARLLETGSALLRHTSPQDNFWGVGRSGKGQNKLGLLLMKIRDELRAPAPVAAPAAVLNFPTNVPAAPAFPEIPAPSVAPPTSFPVIPIAPAATATPASDIPDVSQTLTPEEQAAVSFVESLPPAEMPVEIVMPEQEDASAAPQQPEENFKVIRF